MGALLNCALALHSSPLSLAHIIDELLVQPFTAMKSLLLLPAALGFLLGTVTLLFWSFLRAIVLRSLLQYNGWFLKPKSPLNKVIISLTFCIYTYMYVYTITCTCIYIIYYYYYYYYYTFCLVFLDLVLVNASLARP